MLHYAIAELRNTFSELLNRVNYNGERIALTRHGKRVAALVPVEDADFMEALETMVDLDAAKKALKEAGPNEPWSKVKKELGW